MRPAAPRAIRALGSVALVALSGLVASGCSGGSEAEARAAAEAAVIVDSTDLAVVDSGTIQTGPLLSGSLEPRQQATVRSEVGGTILEALVEPGETVRRGQTLVRIASDGSAENLESARAQVSSAENQLEVARRDVERNERLVEAGAIAERELENARNRVATARAQLADARARLTQAEKQVGDRRPSAPFAGVVSRRPVSSGDVITPGTELATVIDPSSLRLVATIPPESLGGIEVGSPVDFSVTGYPDRRFTGEVERIVPAVDPATRQVTLYVAIPNSGGDLVSGLFAEGRVASRSRRAVVVPLAATALPSGDSTTGTLLRVADGHVERVDATFGMLDPLTDRVEVISGAAAGDTVLMGPAREITPGTPVRVAGDTASAAVADSGSARGG